MFSTRWRMRSSNADARSSWARATSFSVVAVAAGEQLAPFVDDGDVVGREAGDGGGHEVLNRGDLTIAETRARLEHDGGRWRLVGLGEDLTLGNDEVDAGGFDGVDRADGARRARPRARADD